LDSDILPKYSGLLANLPSEQFLDRKLGFIAKGLGMKHIKCICFSTANFAYFLNMFGAKGEYGHLRN